VKHDSLAVKNNMITTPDKFFPDGHARQEKCRKLSGKVIRDGYRQG
jgi:hypothetical protein